MIIKRGKELLTTKAPGHYFTGETALTAFVKNEGLPGNVVEVKFGPGSRTYWHTHPVGQILIVTEGKGLVQKKGEPVHEIFPGDVVTILANEVHWHGAVPGFGFTHIAINLFHEGEEETVWLEEVSNKEYEGLL